MLGIKLKLAYAAFFLITGCLFLLFLPRPTPSPDVTVKGTKVVYWRNANESDALKLATYISEREKLRVSRTELERSTGETQISILLTYKDELDREALTRFKRMARDLIELGFPTPIAIKLTNSTNTRSEILRLAEEGQ